MVTAVHTGVGGRARFKVRGLYRSDLLKRYLEERLAGADGVIAASANVLTGNVLVTFNSGNGHGDIGALLARLLSAYGTAADPRPAPAGPPARPVPPPTRTLRKAPRRVVAAPRAGAPPAPRSDAAPAPQGPAWHTMEVKAVLDAVGTDRTTGLSGADVAGRLREFGPNRLPEAVPRSRLAMFLGQIRSGPVALLGGAAVLSVATGGVADAVVILSVVMVNAVLGYTIESRTERTIHALKRLVHPRAHVLRGGKVREVPAEEVVPGDVLVLRPGSYVPADARLLEARHLSVDESTLTGESMPAIKSAEPVPGARAPIGDRHSMAYMGTLVTGGQGLAVAVATGRATEIGHIQALVGDTRPPATTMERQLGTLGNQLVIASGAVCVGVFLLGLMRGHGFLAMLKSAVSLAVAAVPEGLPTVATTTLAFGIGSMRRRNVLIRRLDAVEVLGSIQTLCLDKTGTLTMNHMAVTETHVGMRHLTAADGRFHLDDRPADPEAHPELGGLLRVCALCSETEVEEGPSGVVLRGSSTENALVHMAVGAGIDVPALRRQLPMEHIVHRAEGRNYMVTVHRTSPRDRLVAVKGSPSEVLARCDRYQKDGRVVPLTQGDRLAIELENERMARAALRVLGVASVVRDGEADGGSDDGLVWLGLVAMADPVRPGTAALMRDFHAAGIHTIMITGDQSLTAYSVAKDLGMNGTGELEIVDSTQLDNIDPEVLTALSRRANVFARVSPAHKLEIVQALQRGGAVVAMTGDGVNDGPALKAADIGVAMGHTGTDVARDVADVVLEDDDLQTMIVAIRHGRTTYTNIRKSIRFLLATNLSEVIVMVAAVAGGLGEPLSAMQLLWINLLSDIFPGLALAQEPPEPDVMQRPPRDPHEPILGRTELKRIGLEGSVLAGGALAAYGYGIARYGIGPRASTLAFMGLTTGQLLHALSCRSRHRVVVGTGGAEPLPPNRYLTMALGGTLALQVAALAVPGLRSLLGVTPIGLADALVIGAAAGGPLLINEMTKGPNHRNGEGRP